MTVFFVTGGAGFIGSNFAHRLIDESHSVINLDVLNYAGNLKNIDDLSRFEQHTFVHGSINDRAFVTSLLSEHRPSVIVNFAAETHVDRSIDDPGVFVHTNVVGTHELLLATLVYWQALSAQDRAKFRFLQVSTDEVYGPVAVGRCTELSRYAPSSPYAASKAAAEHLVQAYYNTYGLPALVTNCSNNYGPRQLPEKLIPKMISCALSGRTMGIYGDGLHRRDWLYVNDHCNALMRIIDGGRPGECYNVGGHGEQSNIEVVQAVCDYLDRVRPAKESYRKLIRFVADRPGHDRRYSIDPAKLERELGWLPKVTFEAGLSQTVDWYLENREWCERARSDVDRDADIGSGMRFGETEK